MTAILLAAGVGRRLAPLTDNTHKCLLPVGGRPLLVRMLTALDLEGIREVVIVVGHCADQIRELVGERFGRLRVRYIENPDFARGSVLSLYAARDYLRVPGLIMDADVLFPRVLLRRLLDLPAPSAVSIDRGFKDTGEEVKVYARGPRVIALGKKVTPDSYETVGEGVGFFKFGVDAAPELVRRLQQVIDESNGQHEYEEALHALLARRYVGWADATALPWTEIDFAEDLHRAERDIFPRIVRLEGR